MLIPPFHSLRKALTQALAVLACAALLMAPAVAHSPTKKSNQKARGKASHKVHHRSPPHLKVKPKSKPTAARPPKKPVATKAARPVAVTKPAAKATAPKAAAAASPRSVAFGATTAIKPSFPPSHPAGAPWEAVRYRLVKVGNVGCHVVDIDLNNPGVRLTCARAQELGHTRMTFASLVQHHRPLAAITGTFFDPGSGTVICNLVQGGKLLTDGHHGNTVMVDRDNRAHFLDTANRAGHDLNWSRSEFAISSGPTLLRQGRVVLDPSSEGFRDPGLFRNASRCALAVTPNNRLMFVTINRGITLGGFARVLKKLGASDAINLDGGSSTGLYVRGRYPSRPARSMTNLVMVTVRPDDPLPQEMLLESVTSPEGAAPANVEDYTDPPPSPSLVEPQIEDSEVIRIPSYGNP